MSSVKKNRRFTPAALDSQARSAEILRVAKEMAQKSHQDAVAAKAAYVASHKKTRLSAKQNQRG